MASVDEVPGAQEPTDSGALCAPVAGFEPVPHCLNVGTSAVLTSTDGTVTTTTYVPDKRWGMQAPFAAKVVVTLPSNRTFTRTDTLLPLAVS